MSFSVSWSYPARADLHAIHWREASDVDAAVERFAATGQGKLERVEGRALLRWLIVGRRRVLLQLVERPRSIFVVRVY